MSRTPTPAYHSRTQPAILVPNTPFSHTIRHSHPQPTILAHNPSFPSPTHQSRTQPAILVPNPSFSHTTRYSHPQPVILAHNPSFLRRQESRAFNPTTISIYIAQLTSHNQTNATIHITPYQKPAYYPRPPFPHPTPRLFPPPTPPLPDGVCSPQSQRLCRPHPAARRRCRTARLPRGDSR